VTAGTDYKDSGRHCRPNPGTVRCWRFCKWCDKRDYERFI